MIESLNLGVGRAIPIKQGNLYKKSSKSALNRSVFQMKTLSYTIILQ